jgi:hypothetical protein
VNIVCTLLLWALLPSLGVNASRYLIQCAECQILLHRLLSQHPNVAKESILDCLETFKSNLFGPQGCLKRCRGGPWGKLIHPLGIQLAPTICLSEETVVSIVNFCGRYQAPRRKVDGTDFGCVLIQS